MIAMWFTERMRSPIPRRWISGSQWRWGSSLLGTGVFRSTTKPKKKRAIKALLVTRTDATSGVLESSWKTSANPTAVRPHHPSTDRSICTFDMTWWEESEFLLRELLLADPKRLRPKERAECGRRSKFQFKWFSSEPKLSVIRFQLAPCLFFRFELFITILISEPSQPWAPHIRRACQESRSMRSTGSMYHPPSLHQWICHRPWWLPDRNRPNLINSRYSKGDRYQQGDGKRKHEKQWFTVSPTKKFTEVLSYITRKWIVINLCLGHVEPFLERL